MASPLPAGAASSATRSAMNEPTMAQANVQSIVQYKGEEELENSRLQRLWNENMESAYKNPSGYQRVSVILISWDEELDDLGTKKEVDDLEAVFRNTYNYRTKSKRINKKRKAQVQVNKYISSWVYKEDGDNTLLIVYYAGHGVPDQPGQLKLAGKRHPEQNPTEVNEVIWNVAESNIADTKADVLIIFDCCYAGDLGRNRRLNLLPRSSEFIGATSAGALTKIPGDSSFTTALMWALEKLAKERTTFTTAELVREISEAPKFPKKQVPILAERNATSYVRIVLSTMSKDDDANLPQNTRCPGDNADIQPLNPHHLELHFGFDNKPEDKEIVNLALVLGSLVNNHDLSACRIGWGGLRSPDVIKLAASKFREGGERWRARARHASNGAPPNTLPSASFLDTNGSRSPCLFPPITQPWESADRERVDNGCTPPSDGSLNNQVQSAEEMIPCQTRKKRRRNAEPNDEPQP